MCSLRLFSVFVELGPQPLPQLVRNFPFCKEMWRSRGKNREMRIVRKSEGNLKVKKDFKRNLRNECMHFKLHVLHELRVLKMIYRHQKISDWD